jgi:ATP/maltotriose-dependent transcriptional regulator MalT
MSRRFLILESDPRRGAELRDLFSAAQEVEVGITTVEELRSALDLDASVDAVLMPPRMARLLLRQLPPDREGPLTEREREVLALLARRWAYKEIAAKLVLSSHTVHSHAKRIYEKLGVRGRREAIAWARRQGWLETEKAAEHEAPPPLPASP